MPANIKEKAMAASSIQDVVKHLLSSGAIDKSGADQYLENYEYFEERRREIEHGFASKWVASINKDLCCADSIRDLERKLSDMPGSDRAYVEYIPGGDDA